MTQSSAPTGFVNSASVILGKLPNWLTLIQLNYHSWKVASTYLFYECYPWVDRSMSKQQYLSVLTNQNRHPWPVCSHTSSVQSHNLEVWGLKRDEKSMTAVNICRVIQLFVVVFAALIASHFHVILLNLSVTYRSPIICVHHTGYHVHQTWSWWRKV